MNKAIVILLLSTLGLGTASAYLHSQLKAERERTSALAARVTELEHAGAVSATAPVLNPFSTLPNATVAPPPAAPSRPAAVIGSVSFTAASPVDPSSDDGKRQRQIQEMFARQQRALLKDPEYREAMRSQQRIGLSNAYPDLARELGISADKADKLLDLLVDQQLQSMGDMSFGNNDPATMEAMSRRAQERYQNSQAQINNLLGSDGMQRWQEYQSNGGTRWRVQQLSSALDAAGSPLRDDQRQPLHQILADSEKQSMAEMQTYASQFAQHGRMTQEDQLKFQEDQLDRLASSQERVRNSLSNILTPEQLKAYERTQDQELAMQRAVLRVQRAQMEAGLTDPNASSSTVYVPPGNVVAGATDVAMPENAPE